MIHEIILTVITLMSCVMVHEFAHQAVLREYGYDAKMNFSLKEIHLNIPKGVTDKEYMRVILWGVIGGLVPLLIFWDLLSYPYNLIVLVLYAIGCNHDLKELARI